MENCNLNAVTWLSVLERLSFPLLMVVVTGLIAIVIAAAKVGLRWSAMLVHSALQASAASERKSCGSLKETPVNATPVQVVSTDDGELVI